MSVATTILVKFNVNPRWEQRFIEAGVPQKTPDEWALELKHMLHATDFGRNPFEKRPDIADSGVPVFGKEGEQDVSLNGLFAELRQAGYFPTGVHIRTRTREPNKFNALVIPFVQGADESLTTQCAALLDEILKTSWGHVHVWANPPQSDTGDIIHTVNLSHRDVDKVPQKTLRFNGGRWKTAPVL